MKKYKPTILMDLDGVLNTYTGDYQADSIPPAKQGASKFLKTLNMNYKLVLFTTRDSDLVKQWLRDYDLSQYFDDVTNTKLPAYLIIDDRSICFKGNYEELLKDINNFDVWYKI